MRFSFLLAFLLLRSSLAWSAVSLELFTSRSAFEARLGGTPAVVDFDDVDTSVEDFVTFAADRYAATKGVVITGTNGQYAGRTFGTVDLVPSSAPNQYAPGPMNSGQDHGGYNTDVTFVDGVTPTTVAGFGCVFIDTDYSQLGPSSIAVFGTADQQLASTSDIMGADASQLFRGYVAIDDATDQPVSAIQRVHLVNGSEWVQRDVDEDVTLDDFVFGNGAVTTTTTTTSPTTTTVPTCGSDPTYTSILCRLDALKAAVDGATDLGRFEKALASNAGKARTGTAGAQAQSNAKRARAQLKKVAKQLTTFAHTLRSNNARKGIPEATRTALGNAANDIVPDVKTLRGSL